MAFNRLRILLAYAVLRVIGLLQIFQGLIFAHTTILLKKGKIK